MMTFTFGGVQLSGDDFGDDLRSWVAFCIAFAGNVGCRDKEAALELLHCEADNIIKRVTDEARQQKEAVA